MATVRIKQPLILFFLCLLALPAGAWAQVKFTAEVDQTEVSVGEPIRFKLIVESGGQPVEGLPVVPNWGGLALRGGPASGRQMSVSIVNGAQVAQDITSFEYELAATGQGKFTIPAAQVKVGGKTYQSQPVTINAGVHPVANLPLDLQGEQIISAKTDNPDIDRQLEGRLFLRAVVSNRTPYVREPVIVTYLLYNDRIAINSISEMTAGDNPGAVIDTLSQANSLPRWQVVQHGERQYRVAQLYRVALTPTKAGKLAVNGLTVKIPIPVKRQRGNDPFDPFDDPFFGGFGSGVQATLPSPPLELDVRQLPTKDQPAGFGGTVGDYAINISTDRTQLTTDDLVTLNLTLDGKGAVDLIYPPEFPKGGDFQVVGQSAKATEKKNKPDGIGGSRTFEIVLRPTRSGDLQLPELHYPIFNPTAGRYVDLATQSIPIKVATGKTPVAGAPTPAQPEAGADGSALTADHLHYLHTIASLRTQRSAPLLESWTFWLLHLAAAGLVMGAWQHSRRLANIDPARVRRGNAWRNLERRARFIRQQQLTATPQEVAGHLDHAARAYIGDRFNLSPEGLTRADIERLLLDRAVPESRVRRLCDLIDHCEAMRYAPVGAVDGELGGWLDEIVTIFKENVRE